MWYLASVSKGIIMEPPSRPSMTPPRLTGEFPGVPEEVRPAPGPALLWREVLERMGPKYAAIARAL